MGIRGKFGYRKWEFRRIFFIENGEFWGNFFRENGNLGDICLQKMGIWGESSYRKWEFAGNLLT